jgi:hypothetical protein
VLPKVNRKMFQRVYDQISTVPELHDQSDWAYYPGFDDSDLDVVECGTQRCAGGWTLYLWGKGQDLPQDTILDLDRIAGKVLGCRIGSISKGAARILGLTDEEADRLFYCSRNEIAVEMCRRYATGGRRSVERYMRIRRAGGE